MILLTPTTMPGVGSGCDEIKRSSTMKSGSEARSKKKKLGNVNLSSALAVPLDMSGVEHENKELKYPASELIMGVCEGVRLVGTPVLEHVLESRLPVDTVVACADGRIGAHRIVLTAASPFLGMLFKDQRLGEVVTLLLPDIKKSTMETLLHLAYTGQMIFPPDREEEILSAMECLMFGHSAQLDLTMVRVKAPGGSRAPKPNPSGAIAGPSSSRAREFSHTSTPVSRSGDVRKRRLSEGSDTPVEKKGKKKPKYDENGRQIPMAIRSGVPIGKAGARKLRCKAEKKMMDAALNIIKPPKLVSDRKKQTVRLNVKKLPVVSIRLQRLSGSVCVDDTEKPSAKYVGRCKHHINKDSSSHQKNKRPRPHRQASTEPMEKVKLQSEPYTKVPSPSAPGDDAESGFAEPDLVDSCSSGHDSESDGKNDPRSSPLGNMERYETDSYKPKGKTVIIANVTDVYVSAKPPYNLIA